MISTCDVSSNLWKHEFCMILDQITAELKYSSSKSLASFVASNSEAGSSTSVSSLSPKVTNVVKRELFEMNTCGVSRRSHSTLYYRVLLQAGKSSLQSCTGDPA